jgi:hypothetical protein
MQSILTASLHIGGDGSRVIVCLHYDQARTEDHQEGEHMLLPGAANHDPIGRRRRANRELGFF